MQPDNKDGKLIKNLVTYHDIDLVGLTELNKDWRKVEYPNTTWEATSSWKEKRRIQIAQNTTKPTQESHYLTGSVYMATFGDIFLKILKQGAYTRKLGR